MSEPTTFEALGVTEPLLNTLSHLGYEAPSPIQAATIPVLAAGRDVIGLAQTGTGKTAAFALPLLAQIDVERPVTQALVLTPTRELALQVSEAFTSYSAGIDGLRVLPVYGGQNYGAQLTGLKRGAHIVVGTPGRVIDHLDRGSLDLSHLDHVVLDEADEMLRMGFVEDVERILADTPEYKQVALFSATMPAQIRRLSQRYLHDPEHISIERSSTTVDTIRQRWLHVAHHAKLDALTRLLEVEPTDGVIVFVRTKRATEELADRLVARGFSAAAINGDLAQAQRERTIGQLKSAKLDLLVATDVAARGLDVDRISHVVNFDIPHDTESYVHRIGRTGRAGRTGEALLFVTPRERRLLKAIEKATGAPLTEMPLPSVDDVNASRVSRFEQDITQAMGVPDFHQMRQIVTRYAESSGASMDDIAAALAVMSKPGQDFLLAPDPPKSERPRRERTDDRGRPPQRDAAMSTYRLAVGKRHKVKPGSIVGALANEGGLHRSDFGHISIRPDHSLVELPADLPPEVFDALAGTRISGVLIKIRPDDGPPAGRPAAQKKRKPRHPKSRG